ncbi:DUF7289 family protein [Halodesulfurarchaeum sp.]|uniref:DUF7289 family protein n=1 Tax=Halodesulfurarchaeum sp. TaxID=1980530 RepID=UPI002FC2B86C
MGGLRGQSETLGFALILGFTLISVGAIAAFGGTTLQTTQQNIGAQNAENAMSQFDSRASMVALGESESQSVALGAGQQGTYTVRPDAGWVRVIHENETGGNRTVIYNETLGAVQYRGDTTEIGYQGGGVWRQDEGSVMLSPPEFHYRKSTLTLPVIQINGTGSVAGNPRVGVSDAGSGAKIFPNESIDPSSNPVASGRVTVTVQSKYYDGWARFFESRTEGNVTSNDTNRTATVELIAPETHGTFDMPLDGNSMTLQGIQEHDIEEFTLILIDDQDDSADFNNLDWSMSAQSGGQEFEIQVSKSGGPIVDGQSSHTTIYYSPDGSAYQTWTTEAFLFEAENSTTGTDWNGDGDYKDYRLVLNLTSEENATYKDKSVNSFSNAGFDANNFQANPTFEGHEDVGEPRNYNETETEEIGFIVNHYLALMGPSVEMTAEDSSQDTVSEEISHGSLKYNATEGLYLTYMHISENPINVTVD